MSLALFAINGAFLTFFITLDKSPIFIKLKERYSHLYVNLLNRFKHNMLYAICLNVLIFLILAFKESDLLILNTVTTFIFVYVVIQVLLGFIYLLDISNSLLTNRVEKEDVMK